MKIDILRLEPYPYKSPKKELKRLKQWKTVLKIVKAIRILPEARREAMKKLPAVEAKIQKLQKVV